MTALRATASVLLGSVLVVATLRDIVHEIFFPGGAGSIAHAVRRRLWHAFRRAATGRAGLPQFVGPAVIVVTLALWITLLGVGWAFVVWAFLSGSARVDAALPPGAGPGFADAVSASLAAFETLGFTGIASPWLPLRLLATLQVAVGFACVMATLVWVLSIGPVLARRVSGTRHA